MRPRTGYSEVAIQNFLINFYEKKAFPLIVPNVSLFSGESDLVVADRKLLTSDFEIKISRADFTRDREKTRHQLLAPAETLRADRWTIDTWDRKSPPPDGELPYASRVWYVTPAGLITAEEVERQAPYAGLIHVEGLTFLTPPVVVRAAPRIHKHPLPEKQRQYLERGLVARYRELRLRHAGQTCDACGRTRAETRSSFACYECHEGPAVEDPPVAA